MLLELHFFCQNWPLFCLHFTSSWNQMAVTEQIYSFSLYLALKGQNGARFNNKKRQKGTKSGLCLFLRVLQCSAKSFRRELRQKKYPNPKQMHSSSGVLWEERICHQDHGLLCPLSRRICTHRYLPDKDIHLETCLLLSKSWMSTEKGCQTLGRLHLTECLIHPSI